MTDQTDVKTPSTDDIPLPGLLRHARYTYGSAMRRALDAAGYDDIPGNGLYIIGGLAIDGLDIPLGQLLKELRVSKQTGGQLVDALVTRGYLDRRVDPEDRRKLVITLTERGKAAAAVQQAARMEVDAALAAVVGEENVRNTHRTLAALVDLGDAKNDDKD
jgi:DNA-binding MarR family transcriptional regulator